MCFTFPVCWENVSDYFKSIKALDMKIIDRGRMNSCGEWNKPVDVSLEEGARVAEGGIVVSRPPRQAVFFATF